MLDFGFVESDGVEAFFELDIPGDAGLVGALEEVDRIAEDGVEVAGGLGAGVFFGAAEIGEVLGNFGSFFCGAFDLEEGVSPGVAGFEAGEDEGGVAEDGGEGVIEVERDGSDELECAVEFLFLGGIGIDSGGGGLGGWSGCFLGLEVGDEGKELEESEFISFLLEGADVGGEAGGGAAAGAESELGFGEGGFFEVGEEFFGGPGVFAGPDRCGEGGLAFHDIAEDLDGGGVGATDHARVIHEECGPTGLFQNKGEIGFHAPFRRATDG